MQDDEDIFKLLQMQNTKHTPSLDDHVLQHLIKKSISEFERNIPSKISIVARIRQKIEYSKPLTMFATSVAACVFIFVFLSYQIQLNQHTERFFTNDLQREKIVLAQFNEIFGQRLKAIISVNDKTEIILGNESIPHGQPLVIRMQDGAKSIKIVSFSGQNLQVNIGGKLINFDALLNSNGQVLLVGDNLFWDSGNTLLSHTRTQRISAESLEL